jgi:para-nitrobenzyl esterase
MKIVMLAALLVLVGAGCTASPAAAPPPPGDTVRTEAGELRGTVTDRQRRFEGIPYAAPPVGDLRWQAPEPARPWEGTRDATEPGTLCPQEGTDYADLSSTDEDCLVLNVTTPRTGADKPVIVWIHGDGVVGGGSVFDPTALVETGDAVVVTINYRLGVFGAFGYPGLTGSGTFGLQDQQAALRWVRENIEPFGGDPRNVTVMGQSYGAQSISAHLIAPGSDGLFDRAIVQSPMTLVDMPPGALLPELPASRWFAWRDVAEVEGLGTAMAPQVGCADPATALDCLRALPVERLFPLMRVFQPAAYGGPVLPTAPDIAYSQGDFHRVPVLVGTTRDEHRGFVGLFYDLAGTPVTPEQYPVLLANAFGARAEDVAARYPLSAYPSPSTAWADVLTDRMWATATTTLTDQLAAHTPVYRYEFADRDAPSYLPFPETFPPGAFHAAEVPYLFRDQEFLDTGTPAQQDLSDTMIRYWTNFARAGHPNDPGLPVWPGYSPAGDLQSLAPNSVRDIDSDEYAARHYLPLWTE